jgi:hypothetical protein
MLKIYIFLISILFIFYPVVTNAQSTPILSIKGTHFMMDGKPFDFTGVSFFNALYNPTFNKDEQARIFWLKKFNDYGITVLRVWAEWNNDRGFVDACDSCRLYYKAGSLKSLYLDRLKHLLKTAASLNMVVELVLFSHESLDKKLSDAAAEKAVRNITKALKPYRNLVFEIWNEYDYHTLNYFNIIKKYDPGRIVTNSPGGGGSLGKDKENKILDYLSPHTTRSGKHWEKAPEEIKMLLQKFHKPVVDDEPARTGTRKYGGPEGESYPYDQVLHIYNVWKVGGYVNYHHDMFQTGYGSKAVPPSGIPNPGFSPYHKAVFEFLKHKKRYEK